ncbi:MAG: AMP-binding protein [Bacteroidales bacterium]|nr:AMP-binding protein [Bacteroidales bacterium]
MVAIPQRLFGEALINSARQFPDKAAFISKGEEYSYSSVLKMAENMAAYMTLNGLQRGDRVAIYMHNTWQCAVSIYATSLAGAAFLVINPQTKAPKLEFILNDSGACFLITEAIIQHEWLQVLPQTPAIKGLLISGDITPEFLASGVSPVSFEETVHNHYPGVKLHGAIALDLAALIYTSGSTGFPKGVMMTHQNMVFTSWSLIQYLRLTEDDRIMLLLPLAFDYGLYQLIMSVTLGATLIMELSFTFPASIYKSIEQFKPTVFPGVPTIYAMMIASNKQSGINFPAIEKVTNTAAALPAEFIPELKKVFPNALIFSMYGLTECKRVCYLEPELLDENPNSVGKAIPGTEVYLLTPEGEPVPAGTPGILHVRGPHVMLGYWNREDLSKEMLRPGKLPWERTLCSNDWFIMDEKGLLYFQGRADDIIKSRGEKVSPLEVENVIYKVAGVKEVAVVGAPDVILGEAIIAYVTLHENAVISEKEIMRECVSNLELFMHPKKVIFLDQMPKSTNGKIERKELKVRAASL